MGSATSTGPYRKKKTQVTASNPNSCGWPTMVRQPPAVASCGAVGFRPASRTNQQLTPSTAKLAASAPITQPAPTSDVRPPARAGPTTMATATNVDSSALPATRSASVNRSATSVYIPALPQACSSDETASSTTYQAGPSSPATARAATVPRATARRLASTATSRTPLNPRTYRLSAAAPMVAGSE